MKKNIRILLNPSELGAGTRGSSLGPLAIQVAARNINHKITRDYKWVLLQDENKLLDRPIVYPLAKRIDGMIRVYDRMADHMIDAISDWAFPLILAGDHASAGGTMLGLQKAFPGKRLGVIWIDAHADLHSPYTSPSGNLHGMPLATALGIDNLACQKNNLDLNTSVHWNQLKSDCLGPSDLVYIALRSSEPEEDHVIQSESIKTISVDEVRSHGAKRAANEALKSLEACDIIYVSFDVDSMDPNSTSHGTGTPVENGLEIQEVKDMLTVFCNSPKIVAFELVEVNPCLDEKKNTMAEIALDIVIHTAQSLEDAWS